MSSSFYTVKNVANKLNLAIPTVYLWINQGKFDGCVYRFNKSWRFKTDRLNQWIKRGEQEWEVTIETDNGMPTLGSMVRDTDLQLMQVLKGKLMRSQ
jgi:excisionase family DNA binding protein